MKRQSFCFFLLLSLALGVAAQKTQVVKSDPTLENLRKHIEYLSSDTLEGRRTGENGATAAAGYVANMFANLKLQPGFTAKNGKPNFMQPFPYVTGVEVASSGNGFKLDLTNVDSQRISVESTTPVSPVGFSPNTLGVSARVVFAGFGIVSTDPKFDDYKLDDKELAVKGKVVLIFDGTPDNDNPHNLFGKFDARTKALIAKDKGAVGILLISREAKFEDEKLTKLKYDQSLGEAALPTFVVSRIMAANILGIFEADLATVESQTAAKATPGANPRPTIRDDNAIVNFKVNLVKKQADAYNVIGVLQGNDLILKNEAIVIGAHYDHLGHGGAGSLAANSTEVHHGADDNASGTAALIELARACAKGKNNKRTIIFIAFSGEEEGLFGSSFYVQNPVFPLDKTIAMINLDMVGRLKDEKLTIGGIGTASEWKEIVSQINGASPDGSIGTNASDIDLKSRIDKSFATAGLKGITVAVKDDEVVLTGSVKRSALAKVMGLSTEERPRKVSNKLWVTDSGLSPLFTLQLSEDGFGPSDHSSFYGKKIPVLFFFTGTHNDYHKPSDTADKINYEGEIKVVAFVASIANAIDQSMQRPTYTVAKSAGTSGGRSGFNISLGTIPNYADSTDGLLLDGVRDNSPAAQAGVKAGDKIVKLAGKDIRNVADYTYVLGTMKAGEAYEIVVLRGTAKMTLKIVPVKRP